MAKNIFRINFSDEGGLDHVDIAIPPGDLRLSDLVMVMQQLTNELVNKGTSNAAAKGDRIQCGPGCGVCCNQLVPLSVPEVFFMVERLLKMPLAQRLPYLKKFEQIEQRLLSAEMLDEIRSLSENSAGNPIAQRYFEMQLSCPFLIDGSCSIHQWRPIVCREYNAITDPSLCADPFRNTVRTLRLQFRPSAVLAKVYARLTNQSAVVAPFPLLFDWYTQHQHESLKTWPARHLIDLLLDTAFGATAKAGRSRNKA